MKSLILKDARPPISLFTILLMSKLVNMEQDHRAELSDNKETQDRTVTLSIKQLLIIGGIIVLLFVIVFVWKSMQIKSLKTDHAEQKKQMNAQFANRYAEQSAAYLKNLAKPYVWALRTEMMQGNINQLNQYNNDMVKQKNFQLVMVADTKGVIISSTDKKYEGKNLSALQMENYLGTDSTVVAKTADSLLVMASPIMSFNSKLGTLLIRYAPKLPGGF